MSDQPSETGSAAGPDQLRKMFGAAIKLEASDVLIKAGLPVKLRLRGQLKNVDAEPFTSEQLEQQLRQMLTEQQWQHFQTTGAVDVAYAYDEDNRFRVNVYRTLGRPALAARRVSSEILSYEQLHLPKVLGRIAKEHQGLILLCGVTGSGKSTTIASMLQQINESRACHIVTLEDPVEFIFKDAKAVVSQREIGMDVDNYADGLRSLVRENPDVVLIGELRDRETFEAAVQAAETGHLVFGTVHASGAAQCFSRIYNLFPENERDLIREMFASTMKAIVYQRLVESLREDTHRVPAVEVLLNSPTVRKYILEQREHELGDLIRSSQQEGMVDYHQWLVDLVNDEYIHPRTAQEVSRSPDELKMRLKGIQAGTG